MQFAPIYPFVYKVLNPIFPGCLWEGCADTKVIALTFDDGPHPKFTPQLLETLDRYQIKASFFWLGVCVNRSPEIAYSVWQQAHWIGLHGYLHEAFPQLSAHELKNSLAQTQLEIARACQIDLSYVQQNVRDVRPPNGIFTPQTLTYLKQWNYRPVMWSVVPEDWVRPGIEVVVRRVLQQIQNGSLIVLHDGYCGGEDVAATVEQLIPLLQQQGYKFLTIDQLWRSKIENQLTKPSSKL
jgi:peptidoglycan/xylan/chitin deacetylase (PgdA/CDA1 family)